MKSQFYFALFLVFVLRTASLKLQVSPVNLNCDPHGATSVSSIINTQQKLYNVAAIDIGANNGKAFICGADRKIYEFNQDQNYYIPFGGIAPPIQCSGITVDIKGNPWIVNTIAEGGIIYRYKNEANLWEKVNNTDDSKPKIAALDITCSKLSDCFFSDSSNLAYRISMNDNKITLMDGRLKMIDASATSLCGIGTDNAVYCRDVNLNIESWVGYGGYCLDIAVCKNNQTYVIGSDNNVYRWDGKWVLLNTTRNVTKLACDQKLWYLAAGVASN